jgi:PhoH-like ATPase
MVPCVSDKFTGWRQFSVDSSIINDVYSKDVVDIWDGRLGLYPNMYVELKDLANEKHTALAKVTADNQLRHVDTPEAWGVTPRNREQVFALDALMDESIPVVVLTGTAGTGKTLLTLAAALELVEQKCYKKVILTRPMSEVGKYKLGALPGDASEKFGPYLSNYMTNLEYFSGNKWGAQDLMDQSRFEIIPLQLLRGASFNECLVIADEMQVVGYNEMLTVGTRIGDSSKLVVMGDLNQRDENIAREKTGIYKFINDKTTKESPLVAAIELTVCERSATARLFATVFEEM